VREATGVTPGVPPRPAELFAGEERFEVFPNDLGAVQDHIRRRIQGSA
jgi:threonine synthase